MALGVHGYRTLIVAGGPEGSQIPSSPLRRHAWSGRRTLWKVERGLDSLSASFWLRLYCAASIMKPPWGALRGLKGHQDDSPKPLLLVDA